METMDHGGAERPEHRERAPGEPDQIPPSAKPKAPNRNTCLVEIGSEEGTAEHRHHQDIVSTLAQARGQIHHLSLDSTAVDRTEHEEDPHY